MRIIGCMKSFYGCVEKNKFGWVHDGRSGRADSAGLSLRLVLFDGRFPSGRLFLILEVTIQ